VVDKSTRAAILTASHSANRRRLYEQGAIGPDRRKAMSKTATVAVVASRLRRIAG